MLSSDIVLWVNSNDMVLGKARLVDVHERHLMHRLGVVFFRDAQNRFFLTRLAEGTLFGGSTDATLSFHVRAEESFEEALKRETFSQTGYRRAPKQVGHFVLDRDPEHVFCRVFEAVFDGPVFLDARVHSAGRFLSVGEIEAGLGGETLVPWFLSAWKTVVANLGNRAGVDAPGLE